MKSERTKKLPEIKPVTEIPCMIINGNFAALQRQGVVSVTEDGVFQKVEMIDHQLPGQVLRRDSFQFGDVNGMVLFYVTKDEKGNFIEPKFYIENTLKAPVCTGDTLEYVYYPALEPDENYWCGYCEYETGKVTIQPIYENANYFVHETAEVMKNGKWGTIDRTGRTNLELVYDRVIGNHGQVCVVKKDGKVGLVSRTGSVIIPFEYEAIFGGRYIHSGLVKVCRNGLWGIVSLRNEIVVDIVYEQIASYVRCFFFSGVQNEMASDSLKYGFVLAEKKGRWGVVDFYGNIWVDFKYESLSYYDLRERLLVAKKDGRTGLIDWHDHCVVDFLYEDISYRQLQPDVVVAKQNGKWGMINRNGQTKIDFCYDELKFCGHQWNRAIVSKNDKFGIVDFCGNVLVDLIYDRISLCFSDEPYSGYYIVRLNEKCGVMDSSFKLCIPIEFDDIVDEFAQKPSYKVIVRKNKKYGIRNIIGNIGSEVIYDELRANDFSIKNEDSNQYQSDLAIVKKDGLYGILDGLGRELVAPQFEEMDYNFHHDIIVVKKEGRYGFIDKFGNAVTEPVFEQADCFNDEVASVKKDGKYGYIDPCGNYLIKPSLDYRARSLRDFLTQVQELIKP